MKERMDFRLEKKTKALVELAAELNDMTVSSYMNHLVEGCTEKMIDEIAIAFTSKQIIKNVLGEEEEREMASIVRLHLVNKILVDEPTNQEIWFRMINDWKKIFTDYIKGKE